MQKCLFNTLVTKNTLIGSNNVEICGIESFTAPEYETQDEAVQSLSNLTIPDEDRDDTWTKVSDPWFQDYINQHSKQDAKKLNGAYGIKDDVKILPQGATVDTKATVVDAMTGEDSALWVFLDGRIGQVFGPDLYILHITQLIY